MKINIVGIAGGLGNQMFQYSFYLSLKYWFFSKDYNTIFIAPYNFHNGFELDKVFLIKNNSLANLIIGFIKKYLKSFLFKKRERPEVPWNQILDEYNKPIIYFSGYWQTEKYFTNIEEKIRSTFKFDSKRISNKNRLLLYEIQQNNAVSVHVRRGDYVRDPGAIMVLGGNCNFEYYAKAIQYINGNIKHPKFYFFSDDIDWVKENFSFMNNSTFIDWNKKKDSWQDMMLMSQCKYNIIANSSFSWWGAWLNCNPDKIVIAPAKWFNTHESPDIVPDSWLRM